MADKPFRNVILLDNYRGRGPRGWQVFSQGCVQPPITTQTEQIDLEEAINRFAEFLSGAPSKHRCNHSIIPVQKSSSK